MKEIKTLINGLETNYKIAGQGKTILILHGWGGSSKSWIKVQELLEKGGYRVICPDLPGFGKTEIPHQAWSVSDYAFWVNKFVESLNLKDFFILGHSFGGRITVKFALSYPKEIRALIFCNSAGIKMDPDFFQKIIIWIAKTGNKIFSYKILSQFRKGAKFIFYFLFRHKDYIRADGTMKETIKKVLDEDLLSSLSKINKKTLIIWGEKDKLVPIKCAHIFNEKIAGSELVIIPNVGHNPHSEVPEKLTEIILKFLNKNK